VEVALAIGVMVAVPALAAVLRVALRRQQTSQRKIPLPAPRPPSVKPQRVGAPLTLPSEIRERAPSPGLGTAIENQIDAYVREAIGATKTRLPTGSTPLRLARGSVAPPPRNRTVRDVNADLDEDVTLVSEKPHP
jgi:hypothetical protein